MARRNGRDDMREKYNSGFDRKSGRDDRNRGKGRNEGAERSGKNRADGRNGGSGSKYGGYGLKNDVRGGVRAEGRREKERLVKDQPRYDGAQTAEELPEGILIGRNPVMEAIKSGRGIIKIIALKDAEGSIKKILGMARDMNIPVQTADRAVLDRAAYGGPHQGIVAHVSDYEYSEVSDILELAKEKDEKPFIMILDGIEDPHNLGAIIRTADAAGAHGVIIPKRRAAAVTATAEKAAAGAASYVKVARVTNISQTIDELKEAGLWIAAVDMDGDLYTDTDLTGPIAFVTGSEGKGISRLVKEKCDFCVSIPMKGGVNSLNASNAAAVLMYETVRQRG